METTNANPKETVLESAKMAAKWFSDSSAAMTEVYKKQLSVATNFYGNFYNSFLEVNKNLWNPFKFTGSFLSDKDGPATFNPFAALGMNTNFTNQFIFSIDKALKQINDSNQKLFSILSNQIEKNGNNWNSFNEKYQNVLEHRFNISKNILNSLIETYNKQVEFSIEENAHLQEKFTKELNSLLKESKKLWSDTLNNEPEIIPAEESKPKHHEKKHVRVSAIY